MLGSALVEESCERVNDTEVATERQWDRQEERGVAILCRGGRAVVGGAQDGTATTR